MAFLSGPQRAREILSEQGGLIVLDDGTVELCGPFAHPSAIKAETVAA